MGQPLRVLIVEDNERDAALLLRELQRGGYDLTSERVDTPEAMSAAIEKQRWDLIISDYSMPRFSAQAALKIAGEADKDLPFIIVSGTVGEEVAVEAMRAGARDFMAKGKFSRLLPAIARELQEAAGRAERKLVEQRLRHAQKMEAMGQLTGGIAHDFNNVLGVIVGHIELLLDSVRGNFEQEECADAALSSALRGAELTKRLLAIARQQPLSSRVIDLNERLPGIIAMLQRTLGEAITISATLAENLWPARVDPTQVEDALLNLAINARDAMPEGGALSIETANVRLDERHAALRGEATPGDYVMLSVTDTGVGMPPEVVDRATDPFFTTKPEGKGTGLGLSMIYGFAKQSGGHLSIYSEVGVGTTVRLYVPVAHNETSEPAPDARAEAELPRGGESILVVDDNVQLRRVTVRRLAMLGYQVREVGDGPSALSVLESGHRFDLLFTDIGLPEGLTGYELSALAIERQPWIKVLFTTGYAKVQNRNGDDAHKREHLLRKPYRGQELAEKVREAIDGIT